MAMKPASKEVFGADEAIVKLARADIQFLKAQIKETPRGRIRFCAHPDGSDRLHEMMIVLAQGTYIRPHKHLNKSESFHIIEGAVDVVILDDAGGIMEVIQLGDYISGRQFFYRLALPRFHTLLIKSELLVIHEVTNGPFVRGDAIFAPWAPEETDMKAAQDYMATLAKSAATFTPAPAG